MLTFGELAFNVAYLTSVHTLMIWYYLLDLLLALDFLETAFTFFLFIPSFVFLGNTWGRLGLNWRGSNHHWVWGVGTGKSSDSLTFDS